MCICVNCRHIYNCKLYAFIEYQHMKKKINRYYSFNKETRFIPIDSIIQINIKNQLRNIIIEWDLIECASFIEKPGSWLYKK